MPKTRYIIKRSALFSHGHVRFTLIKKPKEIQFDSIDESANFATKFYFKWWAQFHCFLLNKTSDFLTSYKVEKYKTL